MQAVEEERRQRQALGLRLHVDAAAEPAHRDLERVRPSVRPQGDHLAVEDDRLARQREDGIDDLGHPVRDVREASRERANLGAEAVNLQPRSVELPLRGRGAGALDRCRNVPRRLREHRLDRAEHLEAEPCEAVEALGESRARDGGQLAGEHERPADGRRRHIRGARDRLDHDALLRPLS